jgi:uncharacterized OB-fold protein
MSDLRPVRATGPTHAAFWNYCAAGELRLQACAACGELCWPVTEACHHCGGAELGWQALSGRGTVVSWCRFEQDYYRGALPLPWDCALVQLEEGVLFLTNPEGFAAGPEAIGRQVELAFRDCRDAAGDFRLPVFRFSGET